MLKLLMLIVTNVDFIYNLHVSHLLDYSNKVFHDAIFFGIFDRLLSVQ